jgi:N-succinyldiaminopimelate aminotransferase
MPTPPRLSPRAGAIKGSIYSALGARAAAHGQVFPLHVGDTWLDAPDGCRMEEIASKDHPGLNLYTPVQGLPALLDAIVDRQRARVGMAVERREIVVTAGATGGVTCALAAIAEPGDEVLVLAPYWPLVDGATRFLGAVPVAVPFFGRADSAESAVALVAAARTAKTVALYVNTPNNPTGAVIPPDWVEALVRWAVKEDLWILSDEVYEDYLYEGEHAYARAFAPERTVSAFSFSKAYGMAGYRCGYLVGPSALIAEALKVSVHTVYSATTASQVAAIRALAGAGDAFVAKAKPLYREIRDHACDRLGIPRPQGSTFLFLDVAPHLDGRGLAGFLEDCADEGLLVAPGPSFGPYATHLRLCTTAAPPDVVTKGVEVLARRLGR